MGTHLIKVGVVDVGEVFIDRDGNMFERTESCRLFSGVFGRLSVTFCSVTPRIDQVSTVTFTPSLANQRSTDPLRIIYKDVGGEKTGQHRRNRIHSHSRGNLIHLFLCI